MDGYKTLKKGQLVEFESTQGPKGLHATSIRLTAGSTSSVEHH
jgi:CspA family cold shock protein